MTLKVFLYLAVILTVICMAVMLATAVRLHEARKEKAIKDVKASSGPDNTAAGFLFTGDTDVDGGCAGGGGDGVA